MTDLIFKTIYLAGLILEMVIRLPLERQRRRSKFVAERVTRQERGLLGLISLGMFFLPIAYIFTPWLNFANYSLPDWARWVGVIIFGAALWVFWRAHVDLGRNWSPSLQIREGHSLVTEGIYRYIRHPMYASAWLWGIAQTLLLPNWLAGVGGFVLFLPLYFIRVPLEEQLMIDQFGEAYRDYMRRTGRILPRFERLT